MIGQFVVQGRLIFLHFMKTGGTSFYRFLENAYSVGEYLRDDQIPFDRGELGRLGEYRLISKLHLSFAEVAYLRDCHPDTKVVTLLRDPLTRCFSNIEHWRRVSGRHLDALPQENRRFIEASQAQPVDEFVDFASPRIRRYLGNLQSKMLAGIDTENSSDEQIYEAAMRNLETVDFVGTTDRIENLAQCVALFMGFYNTYNAERLNSTDSSQKLTALERGLIEDRLLEHNQVDLLIFKEAQRRVVDLQARYNDAIFKLLNTRPGLRIEVGDEFHTSMESGLVGSNWHEREGGLNGYCRWAGPDVISTLRLNLLPLGSFVFEFSIVSVISDEVYSSMRIFINDRLCPHTTFVRDGFLIAATTVEFSDESRNSTTVELRFDKSSSAFEVQNLSDHRRKTIALQALTARRIT